MGRVSLSTTKIIKNTIIQLLAIFCLGSLMVSQAHAKPEDLPFFEANYSAEILGISVSATRRFSPISNDVSELYFSADSWVASLEEDAKFRWIGDNITPIRFTHERKILGKSDSKSLTFDWNKNKIVSIDKDKTYNLTNTEKALDHLSFQLQLQYDLLVGNLESSYRIIDKRKFKQYSFEIMDEEVINTELGKLNTVKVKVIRDNSDRHTYIWFAKDWSYLLAKLEQYEDGEKDFQLQITKATVASKTVTGL